MNRTQGIDCSACCTIGALALFDQPASRKTSRVPLERGERFVGATACQRRVCEPGTDRPRLERVCRYAARPPLAQERLELLPDGRVR